MSLTSTTRPLPVASDDAGTGEPAVLCIPGWCGDRSVFEPIRAGFAEHRRILTTDLPDHGGSPVVPDFDTSALVDAVIDLIERSGVRQVVPLTLSHAGWVGIELRRRLGAERVPGLVLLDWMALGPPPGFLDALAGLQDDQAWQQVRASLFGMWTAGVDAAPVHAYVDAMGSYGFRHWRRAGREIAASFTAEGTPLAALERLGTPCPTLHLYAQPAAEALLTAQQAYAADHAWFSVHRLDAQSHFPTFEVPQEIVTATEEFLCRMP